MKDYIDGIKSNGESKEEQRDMNINQMCTDPQSKYQKTPQQHTMN